MIKSIFIGSLVLGTVFSAASFSSFFGPKVVTIATIKLIDAPIDVVYDQIRYLHKFPEWSPFLVADPQQKNHVSGEDGQLGSTFHWEGVGEKSKGSQSIVELEKNQRVLMRCDITVPFEAKPTFEYTMKKVGNETEITQTFITEMTFPGSLFATIFGMEKQMKATNELGMTRLKNLLEGRSVELASNN